MATPRITESVRLSQATNTRRLRKNLRLRGLLGSQKGLMTQFPSVGLEGTIEITHLFLQYLRGCLHQSLGATFDLW